MSENKSVRELEMLSALAVGVALGGVIAFTLLSYFWEWGAVKGAKWWEVMTAFGTVGAVVVTLSHLWYRHRKDSAQLLVLADLATPVIRAKIIDLKAQARQMYIKRGALIAILSTRKEERARMVDQASRMQELLTNSEMTYLAIFSLTAAKQISAANVYIEHFKFYLSRFEISDEGYHPQFLDSAFEEMDAAANAYELAFNEIKGWKGWR
ncbi:hypothetical protein OYC61_014085 [Alcaligenes nematophilus]|uniref:DUF4760 domain-containing protein n=1 Tax=Alcaligenes nematophilus TaxID=2994643 RepID=A0ABU3MUM5_9BURK|nr:hypothetical protein [Alcaligenes nematophilus]MDT8470697.1 hypothetical protein [Alcaligenes nematophilus]MDT8505429.1 hypothetical protein [Alcaligenes nematophilus]MDT8526052.1 hypothetical protein [Alcaligenes nematophilus]